MAVDLSGRAASAEIPFSAIVAPTGKNRPVFV